MTNAPANAVLWVHDEMLSPQWLVEDRPAVFVFDEDWIRDERLSLKRIVFLYECLLEMPGVEVRKGRVEQEVQAFADRHGADTIYTASSPLPRIKRQGVSLSVEWIPPEEIVSLPAETDLKRFSRYWRRAEKQVLRPE
ncbi:MAG: hypothetical protein AAGA92_00635 [Planctomycetota bacterium]